MGHWGELSEEVGTCLWAWRTWGLVCDTYLRSEGGKCRYGPKAERNRATLTARGAWALGSLKFAQFGRLSLRKMESDLHRAPWWTPPWSWQGPCKWQFYHLDFNTSMHTCLSLYGGHTGNKEEAGMNECFFWTRYGPHGREKQPEAALNPTQQTMFLLKENGLRERACKEASMGKEAPFNTGQPRQCINATLQKQHLSPYIFSTTNGGRREKCNPKGAVLPLLPQAISPQRGSLGRKIFLLLPSPQQFCLNII